jgi:two-component system sensor histidine kinase CiaH
VVYFGLSRSLMDQVDRNLIGQSEQAVVLTGPGRFQGREGYRGGVFYVAIAPDGDIFANPQQVNIVPSDLPAASGRQPSIGTVALGNTQARVLVRATPDGGRLVVGQSLGPVNAALRSLLLVLLIGGAIGLLLLLAGAWFLAGRALIPIQHAFQRQQEFVADASHELRTPRTVLQATTEILNEHRDEPLARNGELFDDIRHEIGRLVRLTMDLLTLARSDRGEMELLTGPVELGSLAGDVVRRTRPVAQEKGVELALEVDGVSPMVEADPDRLQQVLLILIDNAIKHTPAGGNVGVRVQRQGTCALLEVADTGEGIAPEHLARIFDRFYRADASRSSENGGTGLGLAIAQVLVRAHGGDLSLSSTPGAGTRATVRLPLEGRSGSLGGRISEIASHLAHA